MWSPSVAAASRRLRIGCAAPALMALLLASGPALRGQRPLADQDVLQYLSQTITWYRDVAAVVHSPDSRQAMLADSLRQSSTEAVWLAFEFARAQAAIPPANTPENVPPEDARRRTLAQSASAAEQRAEQAQLEIEQLNRQLQSAPQRSRARLLALRDEVTSEANFAKARRDALRALVGFWSAPDEGGLAAKIGDLQRSVPEAGGPRPKVPSEPAPSLRTVSSPYFRPESSGIVGLATEVFSVSQKMSRLDRLARETDALRQAGEKLRGPLRNALREVIRRG